jgi:hypothetical protein
MKHNKIELNKKIYVIGVLLLFTVAHTLCMDCSGKERLAYSLAFFYGASLTWDCFFSEKFFIGWYPVDRKNIGMKYFVLAIGGFLILYSTVLIITN